MTVRTRIFIACVVAVLVTLSFFALGVRREVRDRLSTQFDVRVAAAAALVQQDLARHAAGLDARLRALAAALPDDPARRAALVEGIAPIRLADYAPAAMPTAGLDYLLLLDADGRVLSSGHFRSDHGRTAPALRDVTATGAPVLVAARTPAGQFLAIVRATSLTVGGRRFHLVAGQAVDSAFVRDLARDVDGTLTLALHYPGGSLIASPRIADSALPGGPIEQIALPFLDDTGAESAPAIATDQAYWSITHSRALLLAVQRGIDRWLVAAALAAVLLAFIMARIIAAHLSRPIEELARRTTRVNLDRLGVGFGTGRRDEIGTLSRMLDAMVQRLRTAALQLRDAERRATVGDMARQVNHDVRNGLLPIRNVVRHLAEVARESPAQLGAVFAEREDTLQGGITWLENLAGNYARLSPPAAGQVCELNDAVRSVVDHAVRADDVRMTFRPGPGPLRVSADPVALRRVIENLTINAIESLGPHGGDVDLATFGDGDDDGERRAVLQITDTGVGIAADDLDGIFNDFFTTKARGTGLGLSIVRRLVADMGGSISVDSRHGSGTTFRIELPAVP